jgi:pantoate--beta-alanine ligase
MSEQKLRVLRTVGAYRRWLDSRSDWDGPVVLVPTMGALHAGHAALIRRARRLAGNSGTVVVSVFVNPTQFGPKEDLSRYPRPFAADKRLCEACGADAIFHPSAEEMYGEGNTVWVDESVLSLGLCGAARPGHFRGVCTVVLKLFMICAPDEAVFGRKDYQQCAVIARMVRDLNLPVRLRFEDTVREVDGLAMSSRNTYLDGSARERALSISRGLFSALADWRGGESRASVLKGRVRRGLERAGAERIDYVELVDGESLAPRTVAERGCVLLVAAVFGGTRLIDNVLFE